MFSKATGPPPARGRQPASFSLEGELGVRLERLQRLAELALDALARGLVVRLEAEHRAGRRARRAREPEAVGVLGADAVDRQHALGIEEGLGRLQARDERVRLALGERPVELGR